MSGDLLPIEVELDVLYDDDGGVVVFISIDGNDFYFPANDARRFLDMLKVRVEFAEAAEHYDDIGGTYDC